MTTWWLLGAIAGAIMAWRVMEVRLRKAYFDRDFERARAACLERCFDKLWQRYMKAIQQDTDTERVEQFLKTL